MSWREQALPSIMRLTGFVFILFFGIALIGATFRIEPPPPLLDLVRWSEGGEAYEQMIATIYIVWGAFIVYAARAPKSHALFLDFTIVANVAHFSMMLLQGLFLRDQHMHLVGDVLLGFISILPLTITCAGVRRSAGASTLPTASSLAVGLRRRSKPTRRRRSAPRMAPRRPPQPPGGFHARPRLA